MEPEPLPGWIVLSAALSSILSLIGHYLFMSDRTSRAYKDAFFSPYVGKVGREAGLGLNYGAAGFGLWALGGLFSYAPPGTFLERIPPWVVVAGFVLMLPVIYWHLVGYPERMKPDWYKKRESSYNAKKMKLASGAADVMATADADELILAGPEGWTPLKSASSQDHSVKDSGRPPAAHVGVGASHLKVNGYRLFPFLVEIKNYSSDLLEVRAGRARSAADRLLALVRPGAAPARTVLDDRELTDGEPLPSRYLQIKASGQWQVALRTVQDLRTFEGEATGTGFDVLHYVGPPGIAVVRQEGATPPLPSIA